MKSGFLIYTKKIVSSVKTFFDKAILKTYKKNKIASVTEYRDILYTVDDNHSHKFDVYVPASASDKMYPIMIFLHDGDFYTGDKSRYDIFCRNVSKTGVVVFNANYSLAPKYDMNLMESDVLLMLEEAMNVCRLYMGDYERVLIGGVGAGAYLATKVVSNIKSGVYADFMADYIKGSVLLYPLIDIKNISNANIREGMLHSLGVTDKDSSIEKYILEGCPDTLIISNGDVGIESAFKKHKVSLDTLYLDKQCAEDVLNKYKTTDAKKIYNKIGEYLSNIK